MRSLLLPLLISTLTLITVQLWATTQPNIVVFSVDDMDYTSVNALGNPTPGLTPNMDRLIAEGLTFTDAHVTTAACAPMRQSMMTGQYPTTNGTYGFIQMPNSVRSLSDHLREAGYFTGSIGKGGAYGSFKWDYFEAFLPGFGRIPELYVTHTQAMIAAAREAGKPFYFGINTSDPHRPFVSAEDEKEHVKRLQRRDPDWAVEHYPLFPLVAEPGDVYLLPWLPDLPDIRKELAQYYSSTRRADAILGLILELFEEEQLLDETLFIFYSDHAASVPLAKNNVYPISTRTPLVIRWPGKVAADTRIDDALVTTVDLMPTLLDVLDLESPNDLDGFSLQPLFDGRHDGSREIAFAQQNFKRPGAINFPVRGIHTEDFSYVWNAWPDGRRKDNENMRGLTMEAIERAARTDAKMAKMVEFIRYRRVDGEYVFEELYDRKNDPWCQRNLVGDPAHADALARMRQRMQAELQRIDDPLLPYFERGHGYPAWWDDKTEMKKRDWKPIH